MPAHPSRRRSRLLSLHLPSVELLRERYLPFLRNGGLFVPGATSERLGDMVVILLRLPDDREAMPMAGRIVWQAPASARDFDPGLGIELSGVDGGALQRRIEALLATSPSSGAARRVAL